LVFLGFEIGENLFELKEKFLSSSGRLKTRFESEEEFGAGGFIKKIPTLHRVEGGEFVMMRIDTEKIGNFHSGGASGKIHKTIFADAAKTVNPDRSSNILTMKSLFNS